MDELNKRNNGLYVDFPERGVVIIVPPQKLEKTMDVHVETDPDLLVSTPTFTWEREVINFEVVVDGEKIDRFDPPIELKVYFKLEELQNAITDGKIIALAYRKPGKDWILFTKQEHNLRIQLIKDSKWAGYFVVTITEWGDPSVSVGH